MRKWLNPTTTTILFLILLSTPTTGFLDMCGDTPEITSNCTMLTPEISCDTYNYSIMNMTGGVIELGNLTSFGEGVYYFNFTLGTGEYIINLCDTGTREVVVVQAEDPMAALAIVVFILFSTGILFVLPLVKPILSDHIILNIILRRSCWAIAIFLMTLNSAMLATIAGAAGIDLTSEFLDAYMFLWGWGGYLMLVFLFLGTLFEVIGTIRRVRTNERMGGDD